MVRMARKGRMALLRARQIEDELLDTPVEAWHLMGGDVVRRERGPWPQRVLLILMALIFLAGFTLASFVGVHAGVHPVPSASPVASMPLYVDPIPKPVYSPGPYNYANTPNPYGTLYPASIHTLDEAAAYIQRIWANKGWGELSLANAKEIVLGTRSPVPPPFLGWPLAGGVGRFSSYFSSSHPAVDIAAPCGTHLLASLSGTVVWAGWKNDGGGYVVDIVYGVSNPRDGNPGNGWFVSYNHQSAIVVVLGQHVVRGQYVGRVGMTGWATGCHVHFMVAHNYVWVNPLPLFK